MYKKINLIFLFEWNCRRVDSCSTRRSIRICNLLGDILRGSRSVLNDDCESANWAAPRKEDRPGLTDPGRARLDGRRPARTDKIK